MTQSTNFNYLNVFSIHCLGLFESYDSIKDIKRETKSKKKITTTIITTSIVTHITTFHFSIFNVPWSQPINSLCLPSTGETPVLWTLHFPPVAILLLLSYQLLTTTG